MRSYYHQMHLKESSHQLGSQELGVLGVMLYVAEPPNLMPPRSARLPLDTKHLKENTKLLGSVGHPRREPENPHFCHQDHK